MSVNHASSASATEAAGPRVPASRVIHPRGRRTALAIVVCAGSLGLGIAAVFFIGGLLVQGVAVGLTFVPRAIVWVALAAQDGADWWSIAGRAGGAVASALVSSHVLWWLIGLEIVGVAALAGLQKMLREQTRGHNPEEETR